MSAQSSGVKLPRLLRESVSDLKVTPPDDGTVMKRCPVTVAPPPGNAKDIVLENARPGCELNVVRRPA